MSPKLTRAAGPLIIALSLSTGANAETKSDDGYWTVNGRLTTSIVSGFTPHALGLPGEAKRTTETLTEGNIVVTGAGYRNEIGQPTFRVEAEGNLASFGTESIEVELGNNAYGLGVDTEDTGRISQAAIGHTLVQDWGVVEANIGLLEPITHTDGAVGATRGIGGQSVYGGSETLSYAGDTGDLTAGVRGTGAAAKVTIQNGLFAGLSGHGTIDTDGAGRRDIAEDNWYAATIGIRMGDATTAGGSWTVGADFAKSDETVIEDPLYGLGVEYESQTTYGLMRLIGRADFTGNMEGRNSPNGEIEQRVLAAGLELEREHLRFMIGARHADEEAKDYAGVDSAGSVDSFSGKGTVRTIMAGAAMTIAPGMELGGTVTHARLTGDLTDSLNTRYKAKDDNTSFGLHLAFSF